MTQTITVARDKIDRFIYEAEECAKQELGFAAMSMIFSVVLSVSQAVGEYSSELTNNDDENLIKYFVGKMTDRNWLESRNKNKLPYSEEVLTTELKHIRHGLAHQLSLPNHVGLVNSRADVKEFLKEYPSITIVICVLEFIAAVKITVGHLSVNYPAAILDPNPKGTPRSIANRIILPSSKSGSPSSAGSN